MLNTYDLDHLIDTNKSLPVGKKINWHNTLTGVLIKMKNGKIGLKCHKIGCKKTATVYANGASLVILKVISLRIYVTNILTVASIFLAPLNEVAFKNAHY